MVIYDRFDVVFQEIPNEVSLAFTIKGCPNMCEGCHSEHLRQTTGNELTKEVLLSTVKKYEGMITCVLFLGGDAYIDDIIELSNIVKDNGLKVAMYSGKDDFDERLTSVLNYYKIGRYVERLGGLTSSESNQKLFRIEWDMFSNMYLFQIDMVK